MASGGDQDQRIAEVVQRGRLARDLLALMTQSKSGTGRSDRVLHPVILELNNNFPGGAREARVRVLGDYLSTRPDLSSDDFPSGPVRELLIAAVMAGPAADIDGLQFGPRDRLFLRKSAYTDNYLFGELSTATLESIGELAPRAEEHYEPLIYKVWLDRDCAAFVNKSYRTIKCDAGQTAFGAKGEGILWAVADTGIQGDHPHFMRHRTLELPNGVAHHDFTGDDSDAAEASALALIDDDGHGTHVAGIIAGETIVGGADGALPEISAIAVTIKRRIDDQRSEPSIERLPCIAGASPQTKLLSLKVLKNRRSGRVSMLLAAIGYVQRINEYGRNLRIHGLNLSLGYSFDPEWFAAGQSPVCKEVDRLVRSGVVVVAAAGNGGYGTVTTQGGQSEKAAHASTIADPGNAELAITVGATHRDRPHEYGVSYFSAKGPTADGRTKPDLVAPGERIVSCALAGSDSAPGVAHFREETGTSMAAPHVSAAVAAFLSVRSEFIGKPERVKALFLANATDLGRRAEFQGAGLIDLMRTLQAV